MTLLLILLLILTFFSVCNVGSSLPLPLFTASVWFGPIRTAAPCLVQNFFAFLTRIFMLILGFRPLKCEILFQIKNIQRLIDFDSIVCLLSN